MKHFANVFYRQVIQWDWGNFIPPAGEFYKNTALRDDAAIKEQLPTLDL